MMNEYIDISDIKINKSLPKIDFYIYDGKYELACSIFDFCNLNCDFCFQKHSRKGYSYQEIISIPDKMYELIKPEFEKYFIKEIDLKLWGGELFADAVPDEFFTAYLYLYNRFKELVSKDFPDIVIYPVWLSNGIFTKYERVEKLLKDTNGRLALSYDPVGRFKLKAIFKQWFKTLKYFAEGLSGKTPFERLVLSITPTKKNINAYFSDWVAKYIFPLNKIELDISYYTPTDGYEEDTPNDEDLYRFYVFLIWRRVFNCNVVENILRTVDSDNRFFEKYCNCKKATQFSHGTCTKNCALRASNLEQSAFYGEYASEINEENCSEYKCSLGIIKRGCLECEWYSKCQMPCWISILSPAYKITECPFKRIYKYIQEHPNVLEEYLALKVRGETN